jgi:hypothetical protein
LPHQSRFIALKGFPMKKFWLLAPFIASSIVALNINAGAQTAKNANLELKLNLRVGDAPLEFGKLYKTASGTEYSVDLLNFYTSSVALVKPDGSLLSLPGVSLTKFGTEAMMSHSGMEGQSASSTTTTAPKMMPGGQLNKAKGTQGTTFFKAAVPAGEYRGVRFEVGVPETLNHQDASTMQLPLGLESGMFWAWNPGYIFFRFEGKAMVNGKATPFLLHLGTDAYRLPVGLFDLQAGRMRLNVPANGSSLTVNLNLAKLFERGPNGGAWDLTKPELRQMHGGTNAGFAYMNLNGAWSAAQ